MTSEPSIGSHVKADKKDRISVDALAEQGISRLALKFWSNGR